MPLVWSTRPFTPQVLGVPQHADLRESLAPEAHLLLESIPPALALRGWALLPPTWTDWIRTLTSLPTAVLPPTCGLLQGTWNHVFTDGSCLHSSEPMYRLASWAAVLAPPCDRCWTPGRASVLCASVLPGVCQTAYRAETLCHCLCTALGGCVPSPG